MCEPFAGSCLIQSVLNLALTSEPSSFSNVPKSCKAAANEHGSTCFSKFAKETRYSTQHVPGAYNHACTLQLLEHFLYPGVRGNTVNDMLSDSCLNFSLRRINELNHRRAFSNTYSVGKNKCTGLVTANKYLKFSL